MQDAEKAYLKKVGGKVRGSNQIIFFTWGE